MAVKDRSGDYIKFVAYLVAIVLINFVIIFSPSFRIDLTKNKIYSISDVSKKVVNNLKEPLAVKVFFTKNLPAPHNSTEKFLHDLLEEYASGGNRYFNYSFYDVSAEEGDLSEGALNNRELANNYGIRPVQIQVLEGDQMRFMNAYMGLVIIHGDTIEQIPMISSTDKLEYRMTTSIQKLTNKISTLMALTEKVKVKMYLSSSLESVAPYMRLDNLSALPKQIEAVVENLNRRSYDRLEYIYMDPAKDTKLKSDLEKYNIMNITWPDIPERNVKEGEGAIGLVMEYGSKVVELPLMQVLNHPLFGTQYSLVDLSDFDEVLNENMESLININEDLGYLVDHNTLNMTMASWMASIGEEDRENIANFQTLISDTYSIKDVPLTYDDIPESLNSMVIAGPQDEFTDYELYQIDQYLMKGNNLIVFLDRYNEEKPQNNYFPTGDGGNNPFYTPIETGLEKLLEHYGINIEKSYVMDENCVKQQVSQGGEQAIYFAPLIEKKNINNSHLIMNNINILVAAKMSPLKIDEARLNENGLASTTLFSSSDDSWDITEWVSLEPQYITPPSSDDEMESFTLACLVEGEFPSYFDGKEIPVREAEEEEGHKEEGAEGPEEPAGVDMSQFEGKGEFIAKGRPGKLFVTGSAEILKDAIIDKEGAGVNATFVMNLLDYMNNREDVIIMRGKDYSFEPLDKISGGARVFIKTLNIVGLPVMVVLYGVGALFYRISRKKSIHQMFKK
ncbi:MAG: Gldg family protein [Deltaproteobacteria bacterium]|nr:Gldg family protein [Deltaproteobacteria bacterium]